MLGFFLVWLASIAACIGAALYEGHDEGIFSRHDSKEQLMKTDIVIDGDSTTVGRLLHESDDVESVVDADNRTLRLNLNKRDRNIENTVDDNTKTLQVREAEPKADSTPEARITASPISAPSGRASAAVTEPAA